MLELDIGIKLLVEGPDKHSKTCVCVCTCACACVCTK